MRFYWKVKTGIYGNQFRFRNSLLLINGNNAIISYTVLEKTQADLVVLLLGAGAVTQFRFIHDGT